MDEIRLCFIRFGKIPFCGKSKNYLKDELENGVSVYEAIERNGIYSLLLPSLTGSSCVSLSGCLRESMYEVIGDVVGIGSDGEPLLENCKVVKEIFQTKDYEGWM